MPTIEIPGWLEACRPDDDLYADAYEGTAAELRALLKTAIAFTFHRWGLHDGESRSERVSPRAGFRHCETTSPAPWTLAVLGRGFASPARLLSALVPAVTAGVSRILIVSEGSFTAPVIAALELAGLEDSFVTDAAELARLFDELYGLSPEGRLLVFPDADGQLSHAQSSLLHRAASLAMPRLRDIPAPILSLYDEDSESHRRLRWLYPDAPLVRSPMLGTRAAYGPADAPFPAVPFTAGPGMEACWPGPAPEFFCNRTCSAYLFEENILEDPS